MSCYASKLFGIFCVDFVDILLLNMSTEKMPK